MVQKLTHLDIRPLVLAIASLCLLLVTALRADAGEATPDRFIGNFVNQAIDVLADAGIEPDERDEQLAGLLARGFDLGTISKLAMGRRWRSTSAEERAAFRQLFERYLLTTYSRRLGAYTGQQLTVTGWKPLRSDAMVSSIVTGKTSEIHVDWRVRDSGNGWRVVDVVIEGVSMLVTQRNELASIIERSGGNIEGLLEHMRKQLENEPQTATGMGPGMAT